MRKPASLVRCTPTRLAASLAVVALVCCASSAVAGPKQMPWRQALPSSAVPVTTNAPSNDTCAGAILLTCGSINLSGDTSTANNDYDPGNIGCTGFSEAGRDVVYKIVAASGDSLYVNYTQTSGDAAVYLITDCSNPTASCVAGADNTDIGVAETINYKFVNAGTYYLILDSFGANSGGPWTATGQLFGSCPPPPVNDRCITAIQLPCGSFSYGGTTDFATDDYEFADNTSCVGNTALGKDVVYSVAVGAGDSLWADYTSSTDGELYVLRDCSDPSTCVVGVNSAGVGGVEHLRYRFTFGGTYYIVLDSKDAGSSGTYTFSGAHVCPPPPKNDTADFAQPIPCGTFGFSGSTQYANDDYSWDADSLSCTGYREAGHDVVYLVYATAGDSLALDYNTTADGAVYLVTDPTNLAGTCVQGADASPFPAIESLHYKFTVSNTYYIILDSYGTNTWGTYTITGNMKCPRVGEGVGERSTPELELSRPVPNPFRSTTMIHFSLPRSGAVSLRLVDVEGRVVRTLVDGVLPAGPVQQRWDGRDDRGNLVRAGVYFVKLHTEVGTRLGRAVFVD